MRHFHFLKKNRAVKFSLAICISHKSTLSKWGYATLLRLPDLIQPEIKFCLGSKVGQNVVKATRTIWCRFAAGLFAKDSRLKIT